MNRVILTPAALPSSALAELKQWLGITTADDDTALAALLDAALETCEAFTGQLSLEAVCEETLPQSTSWTALATRPVQAVTGLARLAHDGTRTQLAITDYAVTLSADGTASLRLTASPTDDQRLVVSFTAGLAAQWDDLPASLRHGLIRLCAHQHRERENAGAAPLPPASVAALWRPWRRMRLA